MKLLNYIVNTKLAVIDKKWLGKRLGIPSTSLHKNAHKTYRATSTMNDYRENLVLVRRSSGQKEWMTKEALAELNKQRAIKRKKAGALEKQHWNGLKA